MFTLQLYIGIQTTLARGLSVITPFPPSDFCNLSPVCAVTLIDIAGFQPYIVQRILYASF